MAYIELIPITVTPTGNVDPWYKEYSILAADNIYAICPSASVHPLFIEFYPGNSSNPLLPTDTIITGIEATYSARVSGVTVGPTSSLEFYLYNTNTRARIGSAIQSATITATEVASSVGSSSNKFNFPLEWIDINTFINGKKVGQPWFGLAIKQYQSSSVQIWVDQVTLKVHYTSYNYLVGSRTKFHLGREDLGLDVVMVNGVAHEVSSYIKRKDNGTAAINQVKSHDVNVLGDSLYNIESAMLNSSGFAYALDLKKTYVFAITVSANCDSVNTSTDAIVFANLTYNSNEYTPNLINIYNPIRSTVPNVSGTIMCYWTSAIAWIEHPNRTTTSLYATAQAARFAKTRAGGIDFIVGVTALGSAIGAVEDYDLYETTPGNYQGYTGTFFTSAPASGKIFFKIMAMGRES